MQMNPFNEKISMIGLGRLGAPIAACLAAKGFRVTGVDRDADRVAALNDGRPPVYETGLDEMIAQTNGRLNATTDTLAAVRDTDITFVLVPTPSESDGGFTLQYVLSACKEIGEALANKQAYHLIVLVSTVMPGATGGPVRDTLEKTSGRICGEDFGLCYSPEFVALGSVIHDYLNPDFILIGESDPHSGELLASIYDRVCQTNPPNSRMNFANAELAKIAVNSYVTTKITFANTLAGICQHLPGADVDRVTGALGLDSRIGRKYLTGGVGYGGPCFPRDNRALASVARSVGASAELAESVDHVNRRQVDRLANLVKQNTEPNDTVAVLGLAYKPHSDVVEQSQGLQLAESLASNGIDLIAYDPAAMQNAQRVSQNGVRFADSLRACIDTADAAVVMTPWPEFTRLTGTEFCGSGRLRVVIDPWRALDAKQLSDRVRYVAGGVGPIDDRQRLTATVCCNERKITTPTNK